MFLELRNILFFIVEDFDDLLTRNHFFNIAVGTTKFHLHLNKVATRTRSEEFGKHEHHDTDKEDDDRKIEVGDQHHNTDSKHCDKA